MLHGLRAPPSDHSPSAPVGWLTREDSAVACSCVALFFTSDMDTCPCKKKKEKKIMFFSSQQTPLAEWLPANIAERAGVGGQSPPGVDAINETTRLSRHHVPHEEGPRESLLPQWPEEAGRSHLKGSTGIKTNAPNQWR